MISVVIPLYNKEKSIVATLQSVLAQTYTDYEVIIVDDGSTDQSMRVVHEYIQNLDSKKRERFTLISQLNYGVSAARNAGIIASNGEYVTFLDADDLWASDYLDTLHTLIQDYPKAGLYSIGYRVINSPTMPSREQIDDVNKNALRGSVDNLWIEDMDLYIGSTCSSKERMIRVGLMDTHMTHGEDLDFCWRLILDGGLVRDRKCCAFYRVDAENRAMNRIPALDRMIVSYVDKFESAREGNADFRKFFDEQMVYRLYPYLLDKRYRKEARRIAKKFDYSQLKWSMHFRMLFPWTYYWLKRCLMCDVKF